MSDMWKAAVTDCTRNIYMCIPRKIQPLECESFHDAGTLSDEIL